MSLHYFKATATSHYLFAVTTSMSAKAWGRISTEDNKQSQSIARLQTVERRKYHPPIVVFQFYVLFFFCPSRCGSSPALLVSAWGCTATFPKPDDSRCSPWWLWKTTAHVAHCCSGRKIHTLVLTSWFYHFSFCSRLLHARLWCFRFSKGLFGFCFFLVGNSPSLSFLVIMSGADDTELETRRAATKIAYTDFGALQSQDAVSAITTTHQKPQSAQLFFIYYLASWSTETTATLGQLEFLLHTFFCTCWPNQTLKQRHDALVLLARWVYSFFSLLLVFSSCRDTPFHPCVEFFVLRSAFFMAFLYRYST